MLSACSRQHARQSCRAGCIVIAKNRQGLPRYIIGVLRTIPFYLNPLKGNGTIFSFLLIWFWGARLSVRLPSLSHAIPNASQDAPAKMHYAAGAPIFHACTGQVSCLCHIFIGLFIFGRDEIYLCAKWRSVADDDASGRYVAWASWLRCRLPLIYGAFATRRFRFSAHAPRPADVTDSIRAQCLLLALCKRSCGHK